MLGSRRKQNPRTSTARFSPSHRLWPFRLHSQRTSAHSDTQREFLERFPPEVDCFASPPPFSAESTSHPEACWQTAKHSRIDRRWEWCSLMACAFGVNDDGKAGNLQPRHVSILSRPWKTQQKGMDGRAPRPLPRSGCAASTEAARGNGTRRFEARFTL